MTKIAEWPKAVADTPTVAVIDRAVAANRLPHSIMLYGEDLALLSAVAHAIASRLLGGSGKPEEHPDFFALRPKGKMRFIQIGKYGDPDPGSMRDFLQQLSVSPSVGLRKVGVIYEADRMNRESANAFLKTLEEPPASATLLLLTTRPYSLLPTIRSRVLHFRFSPPTPESALGSSSSAPAWKAWTSEYKSLLGRVAEGTSDKGGVADHIMTLYGLVARFDAILEAATDEIVAQEKEKLPPDIDEDEQIAIETGIAKGLITRLFADIERATRDFAMPRIESGDENSRRAALAAVETLEHNSGLLRYNLNEAAALEDFLLSSLRIWSRR